MTTVIAMWSGPRNLSTAMMRSFGARLDSDVMDEPFFAPFLKASGKAHPGREETLLKHDIDPYRVSELCASPKTKKPYSFQKHMPHHMLPEFPMDWAVNAKHFFLIREPARVIASYAKGREQFDLEDLGFASQKRLFDSLADMMGKAPPVITCADVLNAPKTILSRLCESINIPFTEDMLSWAKGARPEDGAWAPYWYGSVQSSEGFGSPPSTIPNLSKTQKAMAEACQQDYLHLMAHRISI